MRDIPPKTQAWLIALTAILALVLIAGLVAIATLRADLAALDRQVAALAAGNLSAGETASQVATTHADWGAQPGAQSQPQSQPQPANAPSGHILGATAVSDTFKITVTVRLAGPGHLLYEPPVLTSTSTQATYHPTQASLQQAHLDFLSLAAGGEATSVLTFRPVPPAGEGLKLIFNPNHQPGDPVAPRWEMSVWGSGQ